jgi:hypothetical protein
VTEDRGQRAEGRQQTEYRGQMTDFRFQVSGFRCQVSEEGAEDGSGKWEFFDCGFWISECGLAAHSAKGMAHKQRTEGDDCRFWIVRVDRGQI